MSDKVKPKKLDSFSQSVEVASVRAILEDTIHSPISWVAFGKDCKGALTEIYGSFEIERRVKAFYIRWEGSEIKKVLHWFV